MLFHCRLLLLPLLALLPSFAQVAFRQDKDAVAVIVNGKPFTQLKFGAHIGHPYLHPIFTASGKPVTRGFPDAPLPGELPTHPHQIGVWTGHERVNDVDYWETHPTYTRNRKLGRVVFKDVTRLQPGPQSGTLAFVADWVSPDGAAVVTETETVTFHASPGAARFFDVEMRVHANQRASFHDHTDGIFGIRLGAPFEEKNGGSVRNFTGQSGADAIYGQRSPYLTYSGDLAGEKVAVTLMDHPSNFNFPTRWHVRTWANANASNFGEQHFYTEAPLKGKPLPKGWRDISVTLEPGEEMTFRYRVLIHNPATDVDAAWRAFAASRP